MKQYKKLINIEIKLSNYIFAFNRVIGEHRSSDNHSYQN